MVKSASHLLKHTRDNSHLQQLSSGDRGVVKWSNESAEQCPCTGMSPLQLQLDFVSHLMRIGERLSQLQTKELRGTFHCEMPFVVDAVTQHIENMGYVIPTVEEKKSIHSIGQSLFQSSGSRTAGDARVIQPASYLQYFSLGLQLPSQLQSITTHWRVPECTAR